MREIKFRGQRIDNKELVYGYAVKDWDGNFHIISDLGPEVTRCSDCNVPEMEGYLVSKKTVGQYTGLCDKHGKEIYEGDVLFIGHDIDDRPGADGELYIVRWEGYGFSFRKIIVIRDGKRNKAKPCVLVNRAAIENHSEIIGNIYENPELLEATK